MMVMLAATAGAQISTNSPYTRFGLGDLSNQASAASAAMGGIGYGLRDKTMINTMNPASYTEVDSLTFKFDIGMSFLNQNYKEDGWKSNAKNSTFDYAVMQFRIKPWIAFVAGFLPYSNVGYYFYSTAEVEGNDDVTSTNAFSGEGGLHQFFFGLGIKVFKNLSIGFNAGYLYGDIDYTSTTSFDVSSDYSVVFNNITINTYKLDFGLQYTQPINKKDNITLGLVYGLGHIANSTEMKGIQLTDGSTYANSEGTIHHDLYEIPHSFGVGLTYNHSNNLTVGVDYSLEKWSDVIYNEEEGWYNDKKRISAGVEFMPSNYSKKYLTHIRYRAGLYYQTPYLKVPYGSSAVLKDGPKEFGVSVGLGFPIFLFQRSTVLNITGQYIHFKSSLPDLLSENRFVLKLGLTFNEHWFMKWKVN